MDGSLVTLVPLPALLLACLLLAASTAGRADAPPPPLPEGNTGLAARYPGDAEIESDPAVVFHADFEDCRTGADVSKQWDVLYHPEQLSITEDPANVNGGRRALEMTVPMQKTPLSVDVGRNLTETHDVLFLRFYTKFQEGFAVPRTPMHNGGSMSARYYPGGVATPGKRADGRNKFLASFETSAWRLESPGPLMVYLYYPEQRGDYGDQMFPTGQIIPDMEVPHDFGPHFVPRPDIVPERGRWYCLEYMLKANTLGQRDGRVACWVDGKVIADFPNLRLRDIDSLKIDRFSVGIYIADNHLRENKKWYDDVVAATSYIGPRTPVGG
jgi:hypothetical protein